MKEKFYSYRDYVGSLIPNDLLKRKDLSSSAKLLWGRLAQCSESILRSFPSRKILAEELGISETRIDELLSELEEKEFLVKKDGKNELFF